jgi:multidrug resistance efflux pump
MNESLPMNTVPSPVLSPARWTVTARTQLVIWPLVLLLSACGDHDHAHDHATKKAEPSAATNRLAVGENVRRNLGITYAKAEYRVVAATIRVPGRFVSLPEGVRECRGPLPGRIEPVATAYQAVKLGDVLYHVDSPAWRERQRELATLAAEVSRAEAAVSVALAERAQAERTLAALSANASLHRDRSEALLANEKLWSERVTALEAIQQAGGGRASELADARARLATARSERAEAGEHQATHLLEHARVDAALNRQGDAPSRLAAELEAARSAKEAAQAAYALALRAAAAFTGLTVEALLEPVDVELGELLAPDSGRVPRWRSIDRLTVRAERAGVVQQVLATSGAWIEEQTLVMSVVDPSAVRFEGEALQADLARLRTAQLANISAPPPHGPTDRLSGKLALAPSADPISRTISLAIIPSASTPWARPGVSTVAEITVAGGEEELAVPLAAVAQDDLKRLLFRRDPKDPDQVIRIDADLGINDGVWVVVNSGLKDGDEVVLQGVYELALSGAGAAKGGHFHADGTFHAEDH